MNWDLGNYWYLFLLLLLPLLAFIMLRFLRWKKARKAIFAESKFQEILFEKPSSFVRFFPFLYLFAVLFLIFSIIDLLSGSEMVKSKQKMNNVIFLLDISNSMNAEDVQPSRLTQEKNLIINTLSKMKNDKVGIVIFSGNAVSVMPLTTDYSAAETYLAALETTDMRWQGTDFLIAIERAMEKFQNVAKGSRKVVLISDGEDNEGHDNAAVRLANKEGITITTVGVGTEEGAPVPIYENGQLMGYKIDGNGQMVISKRQTQALVSMAQATNGSYIDGNSIKDAPNLIVADLNKKEGTSNRLVKSQNANHYYQYFLGISIFLFIIIFLFNPKRDFTI
jgi:Ca-activated chloride channel family protein